MKEELATVHILHHQAEAINCLKRINQALSNIIISIWTKTLNIFQVKFYSNKWMFETPQHFVLCVGVVDFVLSKVQKIVLLFPNKKILKEAHFFDDQTLFQNFHGT